MDKLSHEDDRRPNRSDSPNPESKFRLKSSSTLLTQKENTEDEEENEAKNHAVKTLFLFMLSNVGLLFLVILYMVGGAFLFQLLEQHVEIQTCQLGEGEWNKLKLSYRSKLFNYIFFNTTNNPWLPSANTNKDGPAIYNQQISQWLKDLRNEINYLNNQYRYGGQDCEKQSYWVFMSAILFVMSIISTIGYGHVTPVTWEGQVVCICYATLGIPLFLMSLAKISGLLSNVYRVLYTNVICYPCKHFGKKKKQQAARLNKSGIENQIMEHNNMDIIGSANAGNEKVIDDDEEEGEGLEDDDDIKIVPLVFVIATFSGYILIGSYIFSALENWTPIQGAYFSFVSLSTMGFGDFVPGIEKITSNDSDAGGRSLLLGSMYLFLGMAILAMCFSLMQEELKEKFTKIVAVLKFGNKKKQEKAKLNDDSNCTDKADLNTSKNFNSPSYLSKSESLPPSYHGSSYLDLKWDKEPTVISVRPTINTFIADDEPVAHTAAEIQTQKQKINKANLSQENLIFKSDEDGSVRQTSFSSTNNIRQASGFDVNFLPLKYELSNVVKQEGPVKQESSNNILLGDRTKSSASFSREMTELFRKKSETEHNAAKAMREYEFDQEVNEFFSNDYKNSPPSKISN